MHPTTLSLTIITILTNSFPPSFSSSPDCPRTPTTFPCGPLKSLSYPFTAGDLPSPCSPPEFHLTCRNNHPELTIDSLTYRLIHLDQTHQTLTLARLDFWNDTCPEHLVNSTLDRSTSAFRYDDDDNEVLNLIYGCSPLPPQLPLKPYNFFTCDVAGSEYTDAYFLTGSIPLDPGLILVTCSMIVSVPILKSAAVRLNGNEASLGEVLTEGFRVRYTVPFESGKKTSSNALKIGLAAAGGTVLFCLAVLLFCIIRRKKKNTAETKSKSLTTPPSSNGLPTPSTIFSRTTPSYPSSLSTHDLEKGSMYFGVQVFTYTELEEATDNFDASRELGDGGFGVVYYGKLQDGRVVAVKRLYENNFKRVEQFINEIEILARLRHRNLVTLYGCTSRKSRGLLLVYEYIPNGTVADHLHGNKSKSGLLTWKVRLNIAIETASALYYLHKSDIIHRDVKTNNILLDNDFSVKVADFGLIRLFPTDMTHVSTAPQGTPGYVDPEYYQCYQLTDKSDVYSFGVVLVELISSLQAVDTNRHRHDINLSNLAINKIQNHTLHELVDPSLGYETDEDVKRMTTLVAELAFRCLQQDRDMRPSMEEVLAALKLIQNEKSSDTLKPEEVDIPADDVGLLKNMPPPFSPDSARSFNWANNPTTTSSF